MAGSTLQDLQVGLAAAFLRNRHLVRAPIWVYRARLGAVFGHRLLMLEHTGRNSGRRRYVVLEVVDQPRPETYVVASGFGMRSQWLRNVLADPHVRVQVGSRPPTPAVARLLEPEEATTVLRQYAERHPKAWHQLKPVLERTLGASIEEEGTALPLVRLDPR